MECLYTPRLIAKYEGFGRRASPAAPTTILVAAFFINREVLLEAHFSV
jgi:hypothetical protein